MSAGGRGTTLGTIIITSVDTRITLGRSSKAGPMDSSELAVVDRLIPCAGTGCPPQWCVLELLRSCSSHPQLCHVSKDEEVLSRLFSVVDCDPFGAIVARFCAYVGLELAKSEPTRLATYLKSSANADFLVQQCLVHIEDVGVRELIDACVSILSGKEIAACEAIKQFLIKLELATLRVKQAERSPNLLRLLCQLAANQVRMPDRSEAELMQIVAKGLAQIWPPNQMLLISAAEWCLRRKSQTPELTALYEAVLRQAEALAASDESFMRAHAVELRAADEKLMRLIIRMLPEWAAHAPLRIAPESLCLPGLLIHLSELTIISTEYTKRSPTSERGELACAAAAVLADSCSWHSVASQQFWTREDIRQCKVFSQPKLSVWCAGQSGTAHARVLAHLAKAILPPRAPIKPAPIRQPVLQAARAPPEASRPFVAHASAASAGAGGTGVYAPLAASQPSANCVATPSPAPVNTGPQDAPSPPVSYNSSISQQHTELPLLPTADPLPKQVVPSEEQMRSETSFLARAWSGVVGLFSKK